MNENKGAWIGGVVLLVLVVLGSWWLLNSQPIESATPGIPTSTGAGVQSAPGSNVGAVNRRSSSVAAIASSIGSASQFASLFASTGVKAEVSGAGPYTIFVPTDAALSQLPAGTIAGLSAAQKKRLVEYHVVSGRAIDADAMKAGTIGALSKDALNFQVNAEDGTTQVNSAFIIKAYVGRNGIVYLISGVLIPPKATVIQ